MIIKIIVIIAIALLVFSAGFGALAKQNNEKDNNLLEIGLRISNEERRCWEFCDDQDYYFQPGQTARMFSGGYPPTCECKNSAGVEITLTD